MHSADNSAPRTAFSQELRALEEKFAGRRVRLSEILEATRGRGFDLLLVFVSMPFVTPIPLPGLSTPFGFVAMLIGARLAVGRHPWLPRRLLERELPPDFVHKLLKTAARLVRLLEYVLRPRLAFMHQWGMFRRLAGGLIMISGFLMLLPLPVPYTNFFPAVTVLLFAAGSLERDGVFFLAGCLFFAVTVAFFVAVGMGGAHALDGLWRLFNGA
ncbi:MAG: exopolysaccharide biosynthesis protein [Chthoniobacteraceae bacterium]|nr:exopolysaccharide biosynthesis protein [Chthoniobacteraceae bacterium]